MPHLPQACSCHLHLRPQQAMWQACALSATACQPGMQVGRQGQEEWLTQGMPHLPPMPSLSEAVLGSIS